MEFPFHTLQVVEGENVELFDTQGEVFLVNGALGLIALQFVAT